MRQSPRAYPQRIRPGAAWPLFDIAGTRSIETAALAGLPFNTLMQRAGLAIARLALALAPHARLVWVAAGPGNNGGDGMEAALHLRRWGKDVVVTWLGTDLDTSADSAACRQRALAAGVRFEDTPPAQPDFCIDALLGIGASRAPSGPMAQWIAHMRATGVAVLSVDVPTGLHVDTGRASEVTAHALATLCLLTLKPGLFTADGRDASAQVWLDTLGVDVQAPDLATLASPCARLSGQPVTRSLLHAAHKGSFGDVAVLGGAAGMTGAAFLAGTAALRCGAGRVYVGLLASADVPSVASGELALMVRSAEDLAIDRATVVCGCGGGDAVRAHLPRVLSKATSLVLDADALNAIAADAQLQQLLRARASRPWRTVLTPHPLEAARLLHTTTAQIQQDRLHAAHEMAQRFQCTVVLKGSGSIIAASGQLPAINPTGNARLATAGTGDVLAGAIGAALAAGLPAFQAACEAVYLHGDIADQWPAGAALTASRLANAMRPYASASITWSV